MSKSKNNKKYKKAKYYDDLNSDDDVEGFRNSEEEYSSDPETTSLTGGESTSENVDSDSPDNLDSDPDDEDDPNDDDRFDPVEEMDEPTDPTEEETYEDEAADEDEDGDDDDAGGTDNNDGYYDDKSETFEAESKACHLKNLNKDYLILDEDDSNQYAKLEYSRVDDEDRISDPIITYYEIVGIIGIRAQQFNYGAEPLVSGLENLHPAKMAYIELKAKMTPFIIRRHLPGKRYEDWKISELEMIHSITDSFFVPDKFDWDALMKQAEQFQKTNNKFVKKVLDEKSKGKHSKNVKTSNSGVKGKK